MTGGLAGFHPPKAFCEHGKASRLNTVTVIDYGVGNLASVIKALQYVGLRPQLTSDPEDAARADRLILPGVGAFASAMANLNAGGFVSVLKEYCASGRPFLGICLGMQLLLSGSEEMGNTQGLDIIPGRVVRFYRDNPQSVPAGLKIPHMGWNSLEITSSPGVLDGIPQGASVYFVHSYYAVPEDPGMVAAYSTHGERFAASLSAGNIFATQFHPEKSGSVGLEILKSFGRISV